MTPEKAIECVDQMINACNELERRLTPSYGDKAHEWLFAVREVLYDMRRLNDALAQLCSTPEIGAVPALLKSFARSWIYEVIPHVQGHMEELEGDLLELLPDSDELNGE